MIISLDRSRGPADEGDGDVGDPTDGTEHHVDREHQVTVHPLIETRIEPLQIY